MTTTAATPQGSDSPVTNEFDSLPEDWRIAKLGDLNKATRQSINPPDFPDEVFDYYSIPAYQEKGRPIAAKGSEILSQKQIVKNGAVLFGKLNPRVEKVWLVRHPGNRRKIASTEWMPVHPDFDMASPYFLYFAMWSIHVMPKAQALVAGSTPSRERVDPTAFYEIEVPLPPLPEQGKIAAVLWKVQQAVETEAAIVRNARDLKKSILRRLFTHGLRDEPLKETEIGPLPESWEVEPAEKLFRLGSGETRPRALSESQTGEFPFPVFGGNGIMGYAQAYSVTPRSLVIGRVGEYCGAVHIAPPQSWVTDNALYSKEWHTQEVSIDYVAAFLDFYNLNRFKRKSSQPLVSQSMVHQVLVPLPKRQDREEIASILQTVDEKIAVHEAKQRALQNLFKTMLQKLMTAQLSVNHLDIDTSKVETR